MTKRALLAILFHALIIPPFVFGQPADWFLPISGKDRTTWKSVKFTHIGSYGLTRKARPGIPEHLHTGVDIKRPRSNYENEPVLPAAKGTVISMRDDGPFAQVIIEHKLPNENIVWTVYEHIAGITVTVGNIVSPRKPIARFMNKEELNRYGWQFDHVHFEVLKVRPRALKPTDKTSLSFFGTYSLECYTASDLKKYYYDPILFMEIRWLDE
ncbi:MAG: M23 family metallopeptidase [Deltaproteobacteria bacterium]|nr:M23 family metallopeptidase [Deltaproteobacteria bacterium]